MIRIPFHKLTTLGRWTCLGVLAAIFWTWSGLDSLQAQSPDVGAPPADGGVRPDGGVAGGASPAGSADGGGAPEAKLDASQRKGKDGAGEPLDGLVGFWGLQDFDADTTDGLTAALEALVGRRGTLEAEAQSWAPMYRDLGVGAESLREQIDNPSLEESARGALNREVVQLVARREVAEAAAAGQFELLGRLERDVARVKARLIALKAAAAEEARRDAEEAKRLEQVKEAAARAIAEMEEAREAEERERDQQIRGLLQERQEVLGRLADLAENQSESIQRLSNERSEVAESFARREQTIEQKLREFPDEPTVKEARATIDPFFEGLVEDRRRIREQFRSTRDQIRTSEAKRAKIREALREQRAELQDLKERRDQLGDTELYQHQLDLAEVKVRYQERRLEKVEDVISAHRKLEALYDDKLKVLSEAIERMLPLLSPGRRSEYYSIWQNENWSNAAASFREGMRELRERVDRRIEQVRTLPERLYSANLWGWVLGFLWRLLLIPAAVYAMREYGDWVVRKGMDIALQRRFFRSRAAMTIKTGELMRSLMWPLVLYFVIGYLLTYTTRTFPETVVLEWFLSGGVIYWTTVAAAKVLFLPRAHRERLGRLTPSPDLGRLSDRRGVITQDVVDVFQIDLQKGRKLVRTSRHVVLFGLLTSYIPAAIAALFAHTVFWGLVESALDWGLLVVVYGELGVWRDEIAELFDRLTGERLQGAADFVRRRKDGIFGVLLIGVASVYVIVVELGRLGRQYVVDTELSRRLANFIFRKRIELKQREEEAQDKHAEASAELPPSYTPHFEERPLFDEPFLIERTELLDKTFAHWQRWLDHRRQGTLSLHGERGQGKTTLLNQIYGRLQAEEDRPVVYADIVEKITSFEALATFLTDLLDIEEGPEDREALREAILERESTIIMLDDCHHLFFRRIGGFRALAAFLDIVSLTDHHHYWILTFNRFGWRYLQRVQDRKHFFGETVHVEDWSGDEIQALIERRNEQSPVTISFTDLVVTREEEEQNYYEVVKTANGYFRLLTEFCGGNPRIALSHWLRNLRPTDGDTLQVSLFEQPSTQAISGLSEDHLFVLTALAQHGELGPREVADIINAETGFAEMALNYFEEVDVVEYHTGTGRYRLTAFYFRPIITRLTNLNFLWT